MYLHAHLPQARTPFRGSNHHPPWRCQSPRDVEPQRPGTQLYPGASVTSTNSPRNNEYLRSNKTVSTGVVIGVLSFVSWRIQKCWLAWVSSKGARSFKSETFLSTMPGILMCVFLNNIAHKNHLRLCSESRVEGQCFPKQIIKLPVHSKF